MTDNAEVLFETTGYVKTLYLPSSIKSIEDQPKYAMGNYESGWEPAYMRAENIIVPVGYKDYYINLFCDDYEKHESHYCCFGDKYKDVRGTLKNIIKEGIYTSVSEEINPKEMQ